MRDKKHTVFKRVPCDICGKNDFERLGIPKTAMEFSPTLNLKEVFIVRCKHCGFYYTQPMPFWSPEDIQNIYNSDYFPEMSGWWKRVKTKVNPQRRLDAVEQYVPFKISRFLEVGCGLGYGLEEAMRRCWDVYGQDVSSFFAAEVKEKHGIDAFSGQLEEANYPERFFDVVYIDSVLEHVPQPMKMLKEIRRILNSHGVAYITVTNEDALINRFRSFVFKSLLHKRSPILSPFSYPFHLIGFTEATFRKACEILGFEVKRLVISAGANEWRKYGIKEVGISLIPNIVYYPIYALGERMGKGIAIEAVVSPNLNQLASGKPEIC